MAVYEIIGRATYARKCHILFSPRTMSCRGPGRGEKRPACLVTRSGSKSCDLIRFTQDHYDYDDDDDDGDKVVRHSGKAGTD